MLAAAPKVECLHEGVVCILSFGALTVEEPPSAGFEALTVEEPPSVLSSLVLLYYLGEIAIDDHTFRPELLLKRKFLGSLRSHALEQVSNG